MWLVKVGGSLMDSAALQSWLGVLASFGGGRVVIVPGGGPFANQVRRAQDMWGIDNGVAHRMAILAMEQYGLMMSGIRPDLRLASSPEEIEKVLRDAAVPVWLPAAMTLDSPELPETWDLTSDSLAAWLANKLGAQMLVLVKSVVPGEPSITAANLCARGVVDPMFHQMAAPGSYETRLMGREQYGMMERMLVTGMSAGTLVMTRMPGQEPEPIAVVRRTLRRPRRPAPH